MRPSRYLIFVGAFFAIPSCMAESVFVRLHDDAWVNHSDVRFSEVADLVGKNQNVISELSKLVVLHCPSLANAQVLNRKVIQEAVETYRSQLGIELLWNANEQVTVRGRKHPVAISHAIDQGAKRLIQKLSDGAPIAFQITKSVDALDVPPGNASIRPEFSEAQRSGSRIDLPIIAVVDAVEVARTVIQYQILPQSKDRIYQNEIAAAADESAVSQLPKPDESNHQSGVIRNSRIKILMQSGSIQLESKGIALATAAPGEEIAVRRLVDRTEIRGRVVDSETVQVGGL